MIEILNRQKRYDIDTARLHDLLEGLLRTYGSPNAEVTLALVNDAPMRALNRRFMTKDASTDVLSFPIRDLAPDGKYYLGDIIISVPHAARQSRSQGHPLQRELEFLVIHGLLHLKGFEHFEGLEEEEETARTRWLEERHER
ncbi:rRNA maturation RNase YbeY [Acidobacteriota bacterium]|jgi:probable rRNA maturation factor